ncbi:MAG: hypothetical protein HC786_32520 [Richelia sp. CSU_2_1]|nr:hypothetical protein [Microcoleus sp. SU_5_6]NJR26494.1 hypothetical protein [Richelia sp. CSU_2_1]
MSNYNSRKLEGTPNWMRFAPYAALGILVFSLNSTSELNYFWKGYLTILQAQAGIVMLYFAMFKFRQYSKNK